MFRRDAFMDALGRVMLLDDELSIERLFLDELYIERLDEEDGLARYPLTKDAG